MWPGQCPVCVCVSSVSALLRLPELRCGQSPEQVKGGSIRAALALSLITGVLQEAGGCVGLTVFLLFSPLLLI